MDSLRRKLEQVSVENSERLQELSRRVDADEALLHRIGTVFAPTTLPKCTVQDLVLPPFPTVLLS